MKGGNESMNKITKSIISVSVCFSLAIGIGYFINTSDQTAFANQKVDQKKEIKKEKRTAKLQEKLDSIWNGVMKAHGIDKNGWYTYDISTYSELQHQPPSTLDNSKDAESLLDTIQEARAQYLKKGDSVPLILVHSKEKKALVLFQRDFGKGQKVVMHFEKDNGKWELKNVNEK
jgi:hypothetical protein